MKYSRVMLFQTIGFDRIYQKEAWIGSVKTDKRMKADGAKLQATR